MRKSIILLALLSMASLQAGTLLPEHGLNPTYTLTEGTPSVSDNPSSVFMYAELVYQHKFGGDAIWVNSNNVSPNTKALIQKAKYSDEALDLLGNEGWELVSAITRNFDGGFEIYFYLKKERL